MHARIEEAARKMAASRSIAVLTGAGISHESGIPTFRGAQDGLWAKYDPYRLATREGFRADPQLVWEWYTYRRKLVERAEPNPGHFALAKLERLVDEFCLVTQNVDGLHRRAGSRIIVELHGNINGNRCFEEDRPVEEWDDSSTPPRCACGSYVRPDVVWFGESLPQEAVSRAFAACETADIVMVVGTSVLVQPAASLPFIALERGGWVLEVNTEPTPLSDRAHLVLSGKSGEILPGLVRRFEELRRGEPDPRHS
jgi:NAD-dependent deacetylase